MSQFITQRLALQPITLSDLDALAAMWADSRVMRYLPTGEPRNRKAAQTQLEYMLSHWAEHGFGVWAIRLIGQGEMIGYCGLLYLHAEPHGVSEETARRVREVELLYGLAPQYWGQGYGREAAEAVIRHGFTTLRLPQIVSAIHPENLASRRILEGLGMQADPSLDFYGDCPHFRLTAAQYRSD